MYRLSLLLSVFFLCLCLNIKAQKKLVPDTTASALKVDTTKVSSKSKDTIKVEKHKPWLATKRSAILPGWGQAYNKEYWKIPIVYGALSIPVVTFIYNNNKYKEAKFAYEARYKAALKGATKADSADYFTLTPEYQKVQDFGLIQQFRNITRRDRDISVLWFLVAWGINVVDATVFGHLKNFDVTPNLSVKITPDINIPTGTHGLHFAFNVKNKTSKPITVIP